MFVEATMGSALGAGALGPLALRPYARRLCGCLHVNRSTGLQPKLPNPSRGARCAHARRLLIPGFEPLISFRNTKSLPIQAADHRRPPFELPAP